MKVAHLLPASVRYPLQQPNGRYEWVLSLALNQAANGHEVIIYCGGGNLSAKNDPISFRTLPATIMPHNTSNKAARNKQLFLEALSDTTIDIFHSHFDNLHYEVSQFTTKPIVATQHWWPSNETLTLAKSYKLNNIWAVPPTRYMYEFDTAKGIATKGHIYHGVDLTLFQAPMANKNGRLLSVGRISPEKNLEISLHVASQTGLGLDIIGKITDKNQSYWDSLASAIDGRHIVYHGTKTHSELLPYYTSALAVLFPSDPHEAFGLVAIEAQACGTPIIMAKGGSRGELLIESKTGYLCSSIEEYVEAVEKSRHLSPNDCRDFAQNFDVQTMTRRYDELYAHLLG